MFIESSRSSTTNIAFTQIQNNDTSNDEQHLPLPSSSSVTAQEHQHSQVPIDFANRHQSSSNVPIEHVIINTTKTDILSSIKRVQHSLSPPLSQLIPDPIVKRKQAANGIFNERNSINYTYPSQVYTLTPIDSSLKKYSNSIVDDLSSLKHRNYFQIGTVFTATSTFLMHQNEAIAQATGSNRFLSDTAFIILITTLAIIVLLFCLGFFCLCRRANTRNISPSFDSTSYVGLNEHSFEIPIGDYQQQTSKYENNIPYVNDRFSPSMKTKPSINHPSLMNGRMSYPPVTALHNTIKQRTKTNDNNQLKKKRIGCFCCDSKSKKFSSTRKHQQIRIKRNEM